MSECACVTLFRDRTCGGYVFFSTMPKQNLKSQTVHGTRGRSVEMQPGRCEIVV